MMIASNGGGASRSSLGSLTKFAGQKLAKWDPLKAAFCSFVFGWVHIAKKLLIKCFFEIFNSQNPSKFKKIFHISLHIIQVAKSRRICVKNFTFIFSL